MFKTLKAIQQNKGLRKKIGFVLLMLLIYKIGMHIPVPGIDTEYLKMFGENSGMLAFMNTLSGGALATFSILAVGIMPYITASIIVQLLQMDIVPQLTEWSKQGEEGKRKTNIVKRVLTIVLAIGQSTAMTLSFSKLYPGLIPNPGFSSYAIIVTSLTIGTILLMIMGELIDKKGIGSGISILIFAGIISSIPNTVSLYYASEIQGSDAVNIAVIKTVLLLLCIFVLLVGIIFINQAYRRIPVNYNTRSGNAQGTSELPGATRKSYLPIKVNVAGVIPVIFAVAITMLPTTIAQFYPTSTWANWIMLNMNYTQPLGAIFYVGLIIAFSYFYAFMQMNPEKTAKDLRDSGGYIPTVKPGYPTERYLSGVLSRLTFVSALFLAAVAVFPMIFGGIAGLPQQVQIGGTSLIIAVSVALDTYKRIETEIEQKQYKGFL